MRHFFNLRFLTCSLLSQLANTINAALAAKGSPSQSTIITKLQSAIASKSAADNQATSHLVGIRKAPDLKNKTVLSCLVEYTRGRLRFEAQLKQGERARSAPSQHA